MECCIFKETLENQSQRMSEREKGYFCTSTALDTGFYTGRINLISFKELCKVRIRVQRAHADRLNSQAL
jgi:hypothetical protein